MKFPSRISLNLECQEEYQIKSNQIRSDRIESNRKLAVSRFDPSANPARIVSSTAWSSSRPLFTYPFIFSIPLSFSLSLFLSLFLSFFLSFFLSLCLSACLPVCLSTCLSVWRNRAGFIPIHFPSLKMERNHRRGNTSNGQHRTRHSKGLAIRSAATSPLITLNHFLSFSTVITIIIIIIITILFFLYLLAKSVFGLNFRILSFLLIGGNRWRSDRRIWESTGRLGGKSVVTVRGTRSFTGT